MFDDVITLFCRFGPKKADAFARTVVRGVHCTGALGQGTKVPCSESRDRALLLIPFSAAQGYVPPAVWRTLSPLEREICWTLQPGDVFVQGEVVVDAASPSVYLRENGGFVITTITERRASPEMSHFSVGAGSIYLHGGGVA